MKCDTCNDTTKYILGLWDGKNNTHGAIFGCHNLNCEIKQGKMLFSEITDKVKQLVIEDNEKNMIFMDKIKAQRKDLHITIRAMADSLDVSCSTYSNYEQCRVALPVEMVGRINGVFREGKGNVL